VRSLYEWYWKLEACEDEVERARILDDLRQQDEEAATAIEKMLSLSHDAKDFMSLKRRMGPLNKHLG